MTAASVCQGRSDTGTASKKISRNKVHNWKLSAIRNHPCWNWSWQTAHWNERCKVAAWHIPNSLSGHSKIKGSECITRYEENDSCQMSYLKSVLFKFSCSTAACQLPCYSQWLSFRVNLNTISLQLDFAFMGSMLFSALFTQGFVINAC